MRKQLLFSIPVLILCTSTAMAQSFDSIPLAPPPEPADLQNEPPPSADLQFTLPPEPAAISADPPPPLFPDIAYPASVYRQPLPPGSSRVAPPIPSEAAPNPVGTGSIVSRLADEIRQTEELRKEIRTVLDTNDLPGLVDNLNQDRKLGDLLVTLASKARSGQSFSIGAGSRTPVVTKPSPKIVPAKEADSFSLGRNYLLLGMKHTDANKHDEAMKAYQKAIDAFQRAKDADADSVDAVLVDYMIAMCFRRMGKTSEAEIAYRRIDSPDARVLSQYAKWQVDNIRRQQDLEKHLQEMQTLRQQAENLKNSIESKRKKP